MNRKKQLPSMMSTLHILNMARVKLVFDFTSKKLDVYLPMFKYENQPVLMDLAIENYFTSWLNYHFQLWNENYPHQSGELFYNVIKLLIKQIANTDEINSSNQGFYFKLISSKIRLLDELIQVGVRDTEKYNALLLDYEKDKVLFEREMNRLKEGI